MKIAQFVAAVSDDVRADIAARLAEIEHKNDVAIMFAVESGSRAWGFPSPDSDYDVRFVYARPVDWYLSIHPGRDVIELPIDGDMDINGWDIRKALGLLVKPNPVLFEWLSSPIRYRWSESICAKLIAFSATITHRNAFLHHYRHLGQSQWTRHVGDSHEVNYKKYFYILRPALAIRWIRLHRETAPPMNLQALVEGLDLSDDVISDIARLLELKSRAKEVGSGQRIASIDALIHEELAWAGDTKPEGRRPNLMAQADDLFLDVLKTIHDD